MYKNLPPLNSLITFEAAARFNSFKLAADELYLTPVAVAYQIRKLEDFLKIELFDRLHRGVSLNNAGQQYYKRISHLLTGLADDTQQFKVSHGQSSLTVLTLHAIAEKWLMPRLAYFREQHRGINIEIKATDKLEDKAAGDIVIGYSLAPPNKSNATVFLKEEIFPVCSQNYLKKPDVQLQANKLSEYDLLFDVHWNKDWDLWLKQNKKAAQLYHKRMLSFSLYSMVVEAAVNAMGIMMGQKQLITRELDNGLLIRPFKNTVVLKGYYYLLKNDPHPQNSVADQFQTWVRQQSRHCV